MKEVQWEQCLAHGTTGTPPPNGGKKRYLLDPVRVGMHVSAKHSGVDVHLKIQDAASQQKLIAEVLYFEPVLADRPDDLNPGDTVVIDREHLCEAFDA